MSGVSALSMNGVNVKLSGTSVLKNVNAEVRSGELVAVLGPSGCGKTSMLNAISGRNDLDSGTITFNGETLTKKLQRKIGVVLQHDVFFPKLTLQETLRFAAMIRMPGHLSEREKLDRLDEIIDTLGLRHCLNTVIGDSFTKGLSGGEKKRASIACEYLSDPVVLLLDEPTTGLDSSTAFSLMCELKTYAERLNRIVIAAVHQPSSQIYNLFNSVILLSQGQVVYEGLGQDKPLHELEKIGVVCEEHHNPADLLGKINLEMVYSKADVLKSDELVQKILLQQQQFNRSRLEISVTKEDRKRSHKTAHNHLNLVEQTPDRKLRKADAAVLMAWTSSSTRDGTHTEFQTSDFSSCASVNCPNRWEASYFTQYVQLYKRSRKQMFQRLSQPSLIMLSTIVAVLTCILGYGLPQELNTVRDRMGLLTVLLASWFLKSESDAIQSVHGDKLVTSKERMSGWYRLSAYYLSKLTSDLPPILMLTAFLYIAVYWISGVGTSVSLCFITLAFFLLNSATGQSIGMLIAVSIRNTKAANVTGHAIAVSSMLIGGGFTWSLPAWLNWMSLVSPTSLALKACSITLFSEMDSIKCELVSETAFPECLSNSTDLITAEVYLKSALISLPMYYYLVTNILLLCLVYIVSYIILRYRRILPFQ